jgi:hypothetical protein
LSASSSHELDARAGEFATIIKNATTAVLPEVQGKDRDERKDRLTTTTSRI